jgi:hypothetical protein
MAETSTKIEKPATFDLDYLLDKNLQVYVGNTTRPAAAVLLSMVTSTGQVKPVRVPRTSLPVCISNYTDRETIRRSNDLRDFIRKGILSLIWPDDAKAALSTPDAIEEMQRLNVSEFSARNMMLSQTVKNAQNTAEIVPSINNETVTEILTPRVMDIVNRLGSNDTSPKAALSELKAMERELTSTDLAHIVSNTEAQPQIKSWAQAALAKIGSVKDDDADDLTPEQKETERQREVKAREQQQTKK